MQTFIVIRVGILDEVGFHTDQFCSFFLVVAESDGVVAQEALGIAHIAHGEFDDGPHIDLVCWLSITFQVLIYFQQRLQCAVDVVAERIDVHGYSVGILLHDAIGYRYDQILHRNALYHRGFPLRRTRGARCGGRSSARCGSP